MTDPRVSVIIPSYQCATHIEQAVKSVLTQTGCSFEVIVIDDGSTDDTQNVIAELASTQSSNNGDKIRYVYQDNQGVCVARNHGVRLAKGEFVVFLDADDYFLPDKLHKQVAKFDAVPNLGIVHTGWQRVDLGGCWLTDVTPWHSVSVLDIESWVRFKPILPSAMMFRREWIQKIGGFNQNYQAAEDVDLVLRLSLAGCRAEWLQEVTVAYRQHELNATKNALVQYRDVQIVVDQFFSSPSLPDSIKLIEPEIRYTTLVWVACYLHSMGHNSQMVEALKQSFHFSPYAPMETVLNWIESLKEFLKTHDREISTYQMTRSQEWEKLFRWVIENQ